MEYVGILGKQVWKKGITEVINARYFFKKWLSLVTNKVYTRGKLLPVQLLVQCYLRGK